MHSHIQGLRVTVKNDPFLGAGDSRINGDTEIDVMAVDHQKKQVFAGEYKYHNKPVDATVYYELEEKVKKSAELRTAFPGYKVMYGLFSKSGFTQRMLDQAEGRDDILLIQEDHNL